MIARFFSISLQLSFYTTDCWYYVSIGARALYQTASTPMAPRHKSYSSLLCSIFSLPFRQIKQTNLPLNHTLLHPPRKHIACCFPLCFYSARMNGLQHFSKCPDIGPLISRKQAELRPAVLACYRTAQTADPMKSHLIKRIHK